MPPNWGTDSGGDQPVIGDLATQTVKSIGISGFYSCDPNLALEGQSAVGFFAAIGGGLDDADDPVARGKLDGGPTRESTAAEVASRRLNGQSLAKRKKFDTPAEPDTIPLATF